MATKTTKAKKLNLIPAPGYILIEPVEASRQTQSGLYLPDTASPEKPQKGKILAVGGDETLPTGVKKSSPAQVGEVVIYKKWGGNDVKIEGKEYLFIKFEDVLAIEK